jgi:hypothetical protein
MRGGWVMHILPTQKFRLFSVQQNGQFLFVSNDMEGPDRVVEAHPSADEERNRFEVKPLEEGSFEFFNTSTETFLFLSNDRRGNDFVIEAHKSIELRNRFRVTV